MSTEDNIFTGDEALRPLSKEDLERRAQEVQNCSMMSLAWDSRQTENVRPAGDGPLMKEFYAEVAKAMRDQHERALTELMLHDRVNRAQRGPQWRAWVHAFLVGVAGGALGAAIIWIANHGW